MKKMTSNYFESKWPLIKHYVHIFNITIGTILFGWLLIRNDSNVVERVILFPDGFSNIMGSLMVIMGVYKIFLTFKGRSRVKKYVLIGITLCWLTISWAYLINLTQNTGSVMAIMVTAGCYIELWRGEYVG